MRPALSPVSRVSLLWACCAAAALLPAGAALAGKAHQHGVVQLGVAVDGKQLSIELDSPLDSLVGFERAPRTDAEKRAAAAVLALLRSPKPPFAPDVAAGCTLQGSEVQASPLDPADAKAAAAKPSPAPGTAKASAHADLSATFTYTCSQPRKPLEA